VTVPATNPQMRLSPAHCRPSHGFVLLEVVIALLILGVTMAALLRSFNQSLKATRLMEVQTQAAFFARQLTEEFEITPPPAGDSEGGFGDAYRSYSFRANLTYVEPEYKGLGDLADGVSRFFPVRELTIDIYYDDGTRSQPLRVQHLSTALIGFEQFSQASKTSYLNY
jgi:prepilin-type N-terminal cleavage/methylation domain-containing protein